MCGRAYVCVCAIFVCSRSGLSQTFIPYSTSLIHRVFQGSRFHDTSWWRLRSVLDWLEPSSEGFTHAFEHPLITVTRRCKAKIRFCFVRPACFVFFLAKATFLHVQKTFAWSLTKLTGVYKGASCNSMSCFKSVGVRVICACGYLYVCNGPHVHMV